MIDKDANTALTLETLAELIKGFQQDMTTRLDSLESGVKTGFSSLEAKGEELRLQMLGLETRHDRWPRKCMKWVLTFTTTMPTLES